MRERRVKGDTPQENATITRAILDGSEQGAKRQAVCMERRSRSCMWQEKQGHWKKVYLAEQLIDSGAARKKLGSIHSGE